MITWLASYPKSGNTWARMLLTAYHNNGHININDTVVTGDTGTVYYQAASVKPLAQMDNRDKILIRYAALLNLCTIVKYRPLVVKTHFANSELYGVRMIPPVFTSGAIYLVRDPRDVAPSLAAHLGRSIDDAITDMAEGNFSIGGDDEILHVISTWSNHVQSWGAEEPGAVLIKYEDMLADTEDALERMLLACNVKPDKERIKAAVNACRIDRLESQEKERGFGETSKHTNGFFNGAHDDLTAKQIAQIESDHGGMMQKMGYELTLSAVA